MTDEAKKKLARTTGATLARKVFEKRGNHSEAHVSEVELACLIQLGAELAVGAMDNRASLLAVENEALRDWRATVTAALRNPGGAHYDDVPKLVRKLKREAESLALRVALLEAPSRLDGATITVGPHPPDSDAYHTVADYDIVDDPRN